MTSILEVDVSRSDAPGAYRLQVIESPAGDAAATVALDPTAVLDRLDTLQQTLLASSVTSRRAVSSNESLVQAIGGRLFDALFSPDALGSVYQRSCAVAAERGEALRLVLRVNAPELAALPWETMFDRSADAYVCRREPLVRYMPVASAPPPLRVELPLRVLAVVASPRGLAPLDVEKEREDLSHALALPVERGEVVLEWVEPATWAAVQDALLADHWHVVHFIGHGDFDVERDEGVLALETEQGRVHRIAAETFVDLLREAQPMPRLVVLNACESSASGGTDMFSGTAAALVRGGVSAVTAMQFEISDHAAIAFCRGFYSAIGRGRGVDAAVRSGRVAILGTGEGTLEWITPTLYLRGRETHLFTLAGTGAPNAPVASVAAVAPGAPDDEPALTSAVRVDPPSTADDVGATTDGTPEPPRQRAPRTPAAAGTINRTAPAPAPPPTAPIKAPSGEGDHPDRLEELWRVARDVSWSNRPFKGDLRMLGAWVAPEETVLGVVRLPLTFFASASLVVTDRFLHLAAAGGAADKPGWQAVVEHTPGSYRVGAGHLRVPVAQIVRPVEMADQIEIHAEHGVIRLPPTDAKLFAVIRDTVEKARTPAPPRKRRRPPP